MVPYLELAALLAASMNAEFLRFSGPPPIFNPLTFPAKAENLLLPRLIKAFSGGSASSSWVVFS